MVRPDGLPDTGPVPLVHRQGGPNSHTRSPGGGRENEERRLVVILFKFLQVEVGTGVPVTVYGREPSPRRDPSDVPDRTGRPLLWFVGKGPTKVRLGPEETSRS